VLGLALDRMGLFTSGCAVRVSRLLLLSEVYRHDACQSMQKLLTVAAGAIFWRTPWWCAAEGLCSCAQTAATYFGGVAVLAGAASFESFSAWAHSWHSSTVSRGSNASSKRARLHVRCLIFKQRLAVVARPIWRKGAVRQAPQGRQVYCPRLSPARRWSTAAPQDP
jgi:hypothetical protein